VYFGNQLPSPVTPSGPRSMIQSATLMISRLCSMIKHGIACIHQALQHLDQFVHICSVQTDRGLVEHIQGRPVARRESSWPI